MLVQNCHCRLLPQHSAQTTLPLYRRSTKETVNRMYRHEFHLYDKAGHDVDNQENTQEYSAACQDICHSATSITNSCTLLPNSTVILPGIKPSF